ncbi:MAG: hypothetical protein A2341_23900 [Deltaproteobacteria bacterium RIFOXYB12_FULL_58_9]|nr:MAG: hypothetical protein A2341_23900 [Deltaproteobacteria bacterium RIFOXYB12_FULL_58_9]
MIDPHPIPSEHVGRVFLGDQPCDAADLDLFITVFWLIQSHAQFGPASPKAVNEEPHTTCFLIRQYFFERLHRPLGDFDLGHASHCDCLLIDTSGLVVSRHQRIIRMRIFIVPVEPFVPDFVALPSPDWGTMGHFAPAVPS